MAQEDNLLILYRDWVRESTGLTGSGEATPYERVQEDRPSRRWVATDDQSAWIGGDAGSVVDANTAAVIAHNGDAGSEVRLRLGTDAQLIGGTPDATGVVYDSDWADLWTPVVGLGFDGFGLSLGGFPILSDFADYRPYWLQRLGTNIGFRYWRLDLRKQGSANSFGDFAVGRLMIGLGLQTQYNIAYGWSWQWVDPSVITDTEESFLVRRRRKRRDLRINWERIEAGEALGPFDDLKRIVGTSRTVLAVVFPSQAQNLQYRTTIYGVPVENGPLSNPYFEAYQTTMTIRELPR